MDDLFVSEVTKDTTRQKTYKMIAMRGIFAFPGLPLHFDVTRDKSLNAVNKAIEQESEIVLVAQKHAQMTNPSPKDIYKVGTLCKIKQILKLPNDNLRVFATGLERVAIESYVSLSPYFEIIAKPLETEIDNPLAVEALKRKTMEFYDEYKRLDSKAMENTAPSIDEIDKFVFHAANTFFKSDELRQKVLEERVLDKSLEAVCMFFATESEILKTEKKISAKVRKQMDKNQREYYLREQMKAIHEELGDGEEELDEIREKAAALKLPKEAQEKVEKELKRLSKMASSSPEAAVIRSYLDWILDIPWSKRTTDNKDLSYAEKVLEEEHYGMEKVKTRILEFLAVHQLTKSLKGPILCFVGPPGVGKTSIVKSIAKSLGRKFVSMSLGGVRDEAEIRGHRRTYIGAIPGRIVYHMKVAGTTNPLFLFDEIDKMASDHRGDPASAMLEVLDPEQNNHFRDNYLELPYDLSQVMFITTANTVDTIPAPLLDRMEVIELSGYTVEEKIEIATRYLVPKQAEANGLKPQNIKISNEVLGAIISGYTRESGVRNLEREIANLCRKIAKKIIMEKAQDTLFEVTCDQLEEYLGIIKYSKNTVAEQDMEGSANGLAYTSVGGTTMTIEAAAVAGKGEISLTGNLGDVMKESARAALTLIKKRAEAFGIPTDAFAKQDIHVHVPEGATPKDGPSAGVTIATALLSCLSGKKVSKNVAMTGEITLRGNVLAIGGLKEKSLAAYRAGIKTIIIPYDNKKDWQEVPQGVKDTVKVVYAKTIDDVFAHAII